MGKFGTPADHVCRRAKPLVESEKLFAEKRFTVNSPLKLMKRPETSKTGRTTNAATEEDYKSAVKVKRRLGTSRQNSVATTGPKYFATSANDTGVKRHKGSAATLL